MNRLRDKYTDEVRDALMNEFGYSSVMQVPRLEKIVLNMGLGDVRENPKAVDSAVRDLSTIAGQKSDRDVCAQIGGQLQTERRHGKRRQSDDSRRSHVPVSR